MTESSFDPVIHEPTRLQICGILVAVEEAEFSTVRDTLGVADSVTSKHLKSLQEAGYVRVVRRPTLNSRPRSWAFLTPDGRAAFAGHLAELRRLAALTPPDSSGGGG